MCFPFSVTIRSQSEKSHTHTHTGALGICIFSRLVSTTFIRWITAAGAYVIQSVHHRNEIMWLIINTWKHTHPASSEACTMREDLFLIWITSGSTVGFLYYKHGLLLTGVCCRGNLHSQYNLLRSDSRLVMNRCEINTYWTISSLESNAFFDIEYLYFYDMHLQQIRILRHKFSL